MRRHLSWFGPSTPRRASEWAGIDDEKARTAWGLVEGELAGIRRNGAREWVLAADLEALAAPPSARGVRLLPSGDPYLQQRDRATLAADASLRRRLFTGIGAPGAVLHDGRLAGLWRARRNGRLLTVSVEPLASDLDPSELTAEADLVVRHRGAQAGHVEAAGVPRARYPRGFSPGGA